MPRKLSLSEKIQFIADLYFRKLDFSNFCRDTHLSLGCRKPNCKYKIFLNCLHNYLLRGDTIEDGKRIFFTIYCMNSSNVFSCFYDFISIERKLEKKKKKCI